ncbi:MAG: molecular chaperone HtpG, partial [Leptospiraceae bacterium]|nr:molecular chaperone HtpG [Leptospiraceae bacterium]
ASSSVVDADSQDMNSRLTDLFKTALENDRVTIRTEPLKSEEIPAMILLPEEQRRMAEMSALWGEKENPYQSEHTLLINTRNPLIQNLGRPGILGADGSQDGKKARVARQVYHLARLSQGAASPRDMENYAREIFSLLQELL